MSDIGLGSWMWRRARMAPDTIALRQGERSVSYATMAARVGELAAGLARHGVHRGDCVAYLGPNDIATFETLFATASLGAVFVPLNTRLSPAELAYMLLDCRSAVLVYDPACGELATAALAALDDGHRPTAVGLDPARGSGHVDFESLHDTATVPPRVDVGLDDDVLILYTSGTTGSPKGAVLTHGNLTFNTVNQLAQVDVLGDDVVLCTAPLFHVVGLGQVTLPALFKGATVVVAPRFDATWMLSSIDSMGINAFAAVPTMLQMLCDHPMFADADLSSVRYVVYGGSPVLGRVATAWLERGVPLLQGYGMTEASPGVLLATGTGVSAHPTSPGVPQFFVDFALADDDGLPGGTVGTGEMLISGPTVFDRYLNRPADTQASRVDGWFRTGDVVRMAPDGWGHVVGRTKDMIISGGENIYPAEVEQAISEVPGVRDCAVVGVPDDRWGEVGLGVVVPVPGAQLDDTILRDALTARLARYKIPQYFRFADELPRTATGKVRKPDLRAIYGSDLTA